MFNASILDPEIIEGLRALGADMEDDAFLQEVIDIYVEDTPKRLIEIHESLAAGEATRLTRAAHSIKGASANLGAIKVIAAAKALEEKSGTTLEGLESLITELETSFEEAKAELTNL